MKRTGIDHPKMARLGRKLGIPAYGPRGIMEGVWHFTAKHAPAGDIGRWSDEEIAAAAGWDGEPEVLVKALVDCRWLDENASCRLVVHDWHEHCEDAVHMALARQGKRFADGQRPKLGRFPKDQRAELDAMYDAEEGNTHSARAGNAQQTNGNAQRASVQHTACGDETHCPPLPSQAKPSQAMPSLPKPSHLSAPAPVTDADAEKCESWDEDRELANRTCKKHNLTFRAEGDRRLMLKLARARRMGQLSEDEFAEPFDSMPAKRPSNPGAWLHSAFDRRLRDRGETLNGVLARIPEPPAESVQVRQPPAGAPPNLRLVDVEKPRTGAAQGVG